MQNAHRCFYFGGRKAVEDVSEVDVGAAENTDAADRSLITHETSTHKIAHLPLSPLVLMSRLRSGG